MLLDPGKLGVTSSKESLSVRLDQSSRLADADLTCTYGSIKSQVPPYCWNLKSSDFSGSPGMTQLRNISR